MSNIKFVNNYNAIDLFCGCGGLTEGLEQAGINVVVGIDHWDKAIETYKNNHKHEAYCADLKEFSPEILCKKYKKTHGKDLPIIDLIVGGPPCQGFSIAGRRDKNDPRNSLFVEYVKYLNYYKPKIFLFENVMGILSMKTKDGENAIDVIMSYLEQNYNCIINKLYASDFEVPQKRRRVIIIGVRKDLGIIPTPIKTVSKRTFAVSEVLLPRNEVPKKYFLSERAIQGIQNRLLKMKKKSFGFGAQFLKLDEPSYTIPARYWKDGYDALVRYDDNNIRRLTELELQRIQSFPDSYKFAGTKKDIIMQIGNAVACRFAYYLGFYLHDLFDQIKNKED